MHHQSGFADARLSADKDHAPPALHRFPPSPHQPRHDRLPAHERRVGRRRRPPQPEEGPRGAGARAPRFYWRYLSISLLQPLIQRHRFCRRSGPQLAGQGLLAPLILRQRRGAIAHAPVSPHHRPMRGLMAGVHLQHLKRRRQRRGIIPLGLIPFHAPQQSLLMHRLDMTAAADGPIVVASRQELADV